MIPFFTGVRWAAQWREHYEGKHTVCWKESRRDGAKNREPREAQLMWSATTSHGQALPSCQTPNSSSPSCFTFLWKPNVQLERCSVEQKGSQFNTFVKMLPCKSTVRIPMSQEERLLSCRHYLQSSKSRIFTVFYVHMCEHVLMRCTHKSANVLKHLSQSVWTVPQNAIAARLTSTRNLFLTLWGAESEITQSLHRERGSVTFFFFYQLVVGSSPPVSLAPEGRKGKWRRGVSSKEEGDTGTGTRVC